MVGARVSLQVGMIAVGIAATVGILLGLVAGYAGRMLSEGRAYFQQFPWMGIFPGPAIMPSVMGFNFLGDGLWDVLDPRLKNL